MSTEGAPGASVAPKNGLGTTALVLGVIGTVLGLLPLLAVVAMALGVLGLVFGGIGLKRVSAKAATNKGVTIAGLVLSLAALVLGIVGCAALDRATDELPDTIVGSDAEDDVTVGEIEEVEGVPDMYGVDFTVENSFEEARDYDITFSWVDAEGERINDPVHVFLNDVPPGGEAVATEQDILDTEPAVIELEEVKASRTS
ncbi:hypothetical protein [Salininema proteolyticum]|uniref:DUF4190 domain-containing protein n=1 Tax=Salininema proteolyticum TaxID=1607685 RepID=A0ABV8TZ34_9ACTN